MHVGTHFLKLFFQIYFLLSFFRIRLVKWNVEYRSQAVQRARFSAGLFEAPWIWASFSLVSPPAQSGHIGQIFGDRPDVLSIQDSLQILKKKGQLFLQNLFRMKVPICSTEEKEVGGSHGNGPAMRQQMFGCKRCCIYLHSFYWYIHPNTHAFMEILGIWLY